MTNDLSPNTLLVKAIRHVSKYDNALDLGAGKCRDSRFLLNLGFKGVTAIDKTQPEFIPSNEGFAFKQADLDDVIFDGEFDLISAQFVLPFIADVPKLLGKVRSALSKDGIFVGQFFSLEEAACRSPGVRGDTIDAVSAYLKDFTPILIKEESRFSTDPTGHYKTWYTIDCIVKK